MRICVVLIFVMIFCACEKKELPAPKYNRGDVIMAQIDLTPNYKNQVWYSLSQNSVVSVNHKTDWDLAFETSASGYHILLNGSLGMRLYKTNFVQLSEVTDTIGLGMNQTVDAPTGNMDSTAFGDWQANNTVYIIDRGYSETGQVLGFFKLKLVSVSSTQFTFEYANIFGGQVYQGVVLKDQQYNFMAYSFSSNQQVEIEPPKTGYDLCFTQYTHVFYNPFQFYQVTGVLINTFNTRVIKLSDRAFSDITIHDTLGRVFLDKRNSIGYDWKVFSLNTNVYTVNAGQCYIINDSRGFYYKLHFIDFYNSAGIKGYPTFEFKKL